MLLLEAEKIIGKFHFLLAKPIYYFRENQYRSSPSNQYRYRQEESIRKDVLRERRIRQTALNERINALQNAMEKDLMVQHELTLDALEKELRQSMDEELVELENSVLAREEPECEKNLTYVFNGSIRTRGEIRG